MRASNRATTLRTLAAHLAVFVLSLATVLAQDGAAGEFRKLEGAWTVTAAEQNGRPFDVIKGGVLTITGRSFALRTAAGNEFKGELRINADVSPRQLDFVHASGAIWEAIYAADDDRLRLNYVEAGGRDTRPTLFATSADTAGTIIVMRRTPAP